MIPSELDLLIWRGTSFEIELVSQVKVYTYDPDVNNAPADLKRSHSENLEHYGFVYSYVDFTTIYASATLDIMKPWRQNGDETRKPLYTLSTTNGLIELTDHSVKLGIPADQTQLLSFDSGVYKLLLTTADNKTDALVFGSVSVQGER